MRYAKILIRRRDAEARINLCKTRRWFADDPGGQSGDQGADKSKAGGGSPAEDKSKSDGDKHSDWFKALPKEAQEEIINLRDENYRARQKLKKLDREQSTKAKEKDAEEDQKLLDEKAFDKLLAKREAEKQALAKELAETKAQQLREKVARKHGLPDDFADVLKGETEEEMTEHAQKLAKHVVKPSDDNKDIKGKKPAGTTTAVPGGQAVGETYQQRKDRIYGGRGGKNTSFGGG